MIVAGVGFSSKCGGEELADLVRRAQAIAGFAATALAAPDWKAGAACLTGAARILSLPILAVEWTRLATAEGGVTESAFSRAAAGVGSVAEAAALAAAGSNSRLALSRIASDHATCALSLGDPS